MKKSIVCNLIFKTHFWVKNLQFIKTRQEKCISSLYDKEQYYHFFSTTDSYVCLVWPPCTFTFQKPVDPIAKTSAPPSVIFLSVCELRNPRRGYSCVCCVTPLQSEFSQIKLGSEYYMGNFFFLFKKYKLLTVETATMYYFFFVE